ncbi:hypothetical protein S7711_01668 [Stachybotrys chartarum IBT 7711]|uniref:Increased loss of mitochondrial DNA protein 1 n=1 Tax=Stachybotrys chartarum (strain CBS 109288 / IBT 7711) TaxID=1280523 RepID=A0A084AV83_STACB|nr:hypothetical protein S7711_01668 [Stachybotrys chartarum IBT 7711]KFA53760.1 hypothetical protein S40293_01695 [Stachybotrys chartarum IBT 40293]KFA77978.1 hypothetical protein S40288_07710 [Stachybotrys chartarum IBT 40288]
MALISARTIITSLSLFHLTLAYFFLASPKTINDQALVYVLGASMGMPDVRGFEVQSPALALVAVVLALLGLGDLVSLSMPDDVVLLYHWGTQAPLRFTFSMILVVYSYVFGPSSPLFSGSATSNRGPRLSPSSTSTGDGLKNRVVFTLMFVEMCSWFWVWITIREERQAVVEKLAKEHGEHQH